MDSLPLVHGATAPLPTLTLPTEVVEEVIDQASDNSASLRQLSLLCKSLLTRARYHLFTSIIIRDVQQIESSREFLDSHPWVPSLIQKVTLSIHLPYDYSKPNIPLLNIIRLHLFTRLPNLRAWRMSTSGSLPYLSYHLHPWLSFHHSTLLCYRIYGSCIQNLELTDIPIQDVSHFVRLISAFTSLHSLTCSDIYVRREHQTVLHDSEILNKLAKPLKIQDLSIDTSVDIRLIEYLLGSSVATLDSLAIAFSRTSVGGKDPETYFERLEQATHRLSELSSLTFVISCIGLWTDANHSQSAVQYIRSSTRILKHVGRARLRDVRVQFDTIANFACSLSEGRSSLEACTALEESLLTFPGSKVQVHPPESSRHRAGRPEFWSPTITSAFPKLNERRSLTLPCTRPSDPLGHEMNVMCLVASPDSKWIVTGSGDGTIIVWDAERSTIEQQWLAHRGFVKALGLSPDSRRLVSAGWSGETLVVWDISNGVSKVIVLASIDAEKGHETSVVTCAWSPDGALIASVCEDGKVHVWDALTFRQRGLRPVDDPEATNYLESLQWSPDSRYLAWRYRISKGDGLSYYDGWTIWSPLTEEPPKRLPSHPMCPKDFLISAVVFDPEGRHIATALRREGGHTENGDSEVVLDGDGSSDRHSGYVQVWDVASGTTLVVLGHARGVCDVSFSPDGRSLLSVSEGGLMKIWDAESWQEMASLEGEGSKFPTACFSPDGKYIATTSNNNDTKTFVVRLWRVGEASCAAVFTEHKDEIEHFAFTPNGEFLASGDAEGIVHIRRLSSFI